MNLQLDDFVDSENRKLFFNSLLDRVELFFAEKGAEISIEELNVFQTMPRYKRRWIDVLEVEKVIKVIEFIKDVINDSCVFKSEDMNKYFLG